MPKGIYQRGQWWWARFKVAGQTYREPLRIPVRGPKEERLAEQRSEERRRQVIDEVRFGISAPVGWKAAVVAWHDAAVANRLRPATIRRYLSSLGQLRDHLDDVTIQEIDAAAVRKLVAARRKDGASNATIRRDMTALAQVLAHAIHEGWRREGDNPALGIDRKKVLPERREPICLPLATEVAAVIAEASDRFGDLIAFAHATGMRQEEIGALEHGRVDRARRCAIIYRTKGRRARAVPLSEEAMAIIDRQPRHITQPWVFWHGDGQRFTSIAPHFGRVRARVAQKWAQQNRTMTGFRFHDLRHDFAVRELREGRLGIYDLQQVLGHSTVKTTEIYLDFLTPDEKAAAERAVAQNGAQGLRFSGAETGPGS